MPPDFKNLRFEGKRLKDRFIIIGSLVFVLPFLVLFYIFIEYDFPLDSIHLALFALILLLILSGVILLRFLFDRICAIDETIKDATKTGNVVSTDMKNDVDELGHISRSFKDMIHCLCLQRRKRVSCPFILFSLILMTYFSRSS